jgi:hypothetical protein
MFRLLGQLLVSLVVGSCKRDVVVHVPKVDPLTLWCEVSDLRRSFVGWLKKAELETKQHRSDIRQEKVVLHGKITSTSASLNFSLLEMKGRTTQGERTFSTRSTSDHDSMEKNCLRRPLLTCPGEGAKPLRKRNSQSGSSSWLRSSARQRTEHGQLDATGPVGFEQT